MATNKKSVQRKADAKRAGKRARAYTAIIYEDSATVNWLLILRELLVECLVSPYHDKDVNPDGTPKKPHWHIVVSFKYPVSYAKAKEIFDQIGAVVPPEKQCRVRDFRQMARYLCHMDQPDKFQYSIDDVVCIGSIDYQSLVMSNTDEDAMLSEIQEVMDELQLTAYSQVVRYAKRNRREWLHLINRKFTRQISEYAKGINLELEKGCRNEYGTPFLCAETSAPLRHRNGVPCSKNGKPLLSAGQTAKNSWNFETQLSPKNAKNEEIEEINPKTIFCPLCGSISVVKDGKNASGTQRYFCKDCGKRFSEERQ